MVVEITIMKTNKMEHFVCGVLATYGLVVACGNMKDHESEDDMDDESEEYELKKKSNKDCPC